ncbi:MAG: hypothetical protein AVDCRST_MAG16-1443, partial [uncultured Frankineae bacterium]
EHVPQQPSALARPHRGTAGRRRRRPRPGGRPCAGDGARRGPHGRPGCDGAVPLDRPGRARRLPADPGVRLEPGRRHGGPLREPGPDAGPGRRPAAAGDPRLRTRRERDAGAGGGGVLRRGGGRRGRALAVRADVPGPDACPPPRHGEALRPARLGVGAQPRRHLRAVQPDAELL